VVASCSIAAPRRPAGSLAGSSSNRLSGAWGSSR